MNREHVLALYNRLTGLIEKLPGGLQKPILRELTPLREVFLESRPARLMLVGSSGSDTVEILSGFIAQGTPQIVGNDNGWRSHEVRGLGRLAILDARNAAPAAHAAGGTARFVPDAIIWIREADSQPGADEVQEAASRIGLCEPSIPLFGLAAGAEGIESLQREMTACAGCSGRHSRIFSVMQTGEFAEAVCEGLPRAAQLEFARITGARQAQAHIASLLLKSFSAICGVIALQPIPLADMPILVALQTLMVGLIIHTTGRPGGPRLIGEFLGVLGVNIGAGFLFRESARALVRVIPIWGNLISGGIAVAGTYAIGRAAIAFFIEGIPATNARRIFHSVFRSERRNIRNLQGASEEPR